MRGRVSLAFASYFLFIYDFARDLGCDLFTIWSGEVWSRTWLQLPYFDTIIMVDQPSILSRFQTAFHEGYMLSINREF
jgi:hypothetical protein